MTEGKVVHFLNHFFAGIGGEEKADTPVAAKEGPVGPGRALQNLLPTGTRIAGTVYAGDNYFNENPEEAGKQVLEAVRRLSPQVLVAGPAFDAGRYGVACAEVCHLVSRELGIPAITAMHPENPGVDIYRSYKNPQVFLFPTSETVVGMQSALTVMGNFAVKLISGAPRGLAAQEGYLPRGLRPLVRVEKTGAQRAVEMLLAKVAGKPFTTEVPLKMLEDITPAPRLVNLSQATIALAATSGVVPFGNPDGIKRFRNTQWFKYSVEGIDSMEKGKWEAVHAGYNVMFVNENPNLGLPLDAVREMEKEHAFGRLHPYFYGTTGSQATISAMQQIGREMAQDMKAHNVDGVLLVAT